MATELRRRGFGQQAAGESEGGSSAKKAVDATADAKQDAKASKDVYVVRMWGLPDGFFDLPLARQWEEVAKVTVKAPVQSTPTPPCPISLADDAIAVCFFLVSLGLPLAMGLAGVYFAATLQGAKLALLAAAGLVLAKHPLERHTMMFRSSRLALALVRYITFEIIVDRANPLNKDLGTPAVDGAAYQAAHLPAIYLACPHGVFNYGAIVWCAFSRWFCGWYQITGTAGALAVVPGIRYMDPFIWSVDASRKNITKVLQQRPKGGWPEAPEGPVPEGAGRTGGMLGMVPDGLLGAFRCDPGVDELLIGSKRGIVRIALEEKASVSACWFFGTTEMLTVVQDPWGGMEWFSRKVLKAGVMGFYGRWGLPVPRRVAITVVYATTKLPLAPLAGTAPSDAEVEAAHAAIYGNLKATYDAQKAYAGYPARNLIIK